MQLIWKTTLPFRLSAVSLHVVDLASFFVEKPSATHVSGSVQGHQARVRPNQIGRIMIDILFV